MSKAANMTLALQARVATISTAHGFATNIGARIFRGKLSLNKEDLPCVVIVEGDESVVDQKGAKIKTEIVYVFEGHDTCDPEQPNDKAHEIIADLKRAIYGSDLTLGGMLPDKNSLDYRGRAIGTRPDAGDVIAASITIAVTTVDDLAQP